MWRHEFFNYGRLKWESSITIMVVHCGSLLHYYCIIVPIIIARIRNGSTWRRWFFSYGSHKWEISILNFKGDFDPCFVHITPPYSRPKNSWATFHTRHSINFLAISENPLLFAWLRLNETKSSLPIVQDGKRKQIKQSPTKQKPNRLAIQGPFYLSCIL